MEAKRIEGPDVEPEKRLLSSGRMKRRRRGSSDRNVSSGEVGCASAWLCGLLLGRSPPN